MVGAWSVWHAQSISQKGSSLVTSVVSDQDHFLLWGGQLLVVDKSKTEHGFKCIVKSGAFTQKATLGGIEVISDEGIFSHVVSFWL